MSLRDIFRRRAIRDPATLAGFVDEQALLLSTRAAEDYLRGRAGEHADALFADNAFRAALDKACWEAYPRALAMAGEVAEAGLRARAVNNAHEVLYGLTASILDQFDCKAVPPVIGALEWRAARADLSRSLSDLAHHDPRTIDAIAESHTGYYIAIMPIHANLQRDDFQTLCRQLRATLADFREQLEQRADLDKLVVLLAESVPKAPLTVE